MALALVVACGAPPEQGSEVVVALENAPLNLDPRIATDQASSRVFEVMLNGLVTKDTEGNLLPDLATSWEVLDDGRRYRFYLREGVRFHDGRVLGARDVVWTFGSILDGSVSTPKRGAFPQIEKVVEIDPQTVEFHLSEPYGALIVNLTAYVGIIPHGSGPDEFNRDPVGTGPFRLVERTPDAVVLEAFDDYWQGRPRIDRLILKQVPDATVRALELQKGSTHLVINGLPPDVVAKMRQDPALQVIEDPGSNYSYVGINLEDPVLSNVLVRRAIAHAIDRPKLIATLWRGLGIPTETMMRPGHWARNDSIELIPHDPARAMELLDQAGYTDPDGDGPRPRLALTFKTSTDETRLLQAQIIQAMLAKVGIDIEIRSYEFATFYNDIKQGNFQLFSLTWTGVIDPDIFNLLFHSERVPPNGANRGRYKNPELDRLIELGARAFAPAERRPHYLAAQEILARELPYISLFIQSNVAVLPRDLTGYRNFPSGEVYGIKDLVWRRP